MNSNRRQMLRRAVAHMVGEAVLGVNFIQPGHHSVAGDLGDDGGCGDRQAGGIAAHNCLARAMQAGRRVRSVHQHIGRPERQAMQRAAHGGERRLPYVDAVNLFSGRKADRHR